MYGFFRRVGGIKITYSVRGGMVTWKFKMAAMFVKLYVSLLIYRCIDLSNPLRIDRYVIFLKIFVIPGWEYAPPPTKSSRGILLPHFQIEVGGTKEQPPTLG